MAESKVFQTTDTLGRKTITDDAARDYYHRSLPGGLPRDWINDAATWGNLESLHMAATMAILSLAGTLHVGVRRNMWGKRMGTDYRHCVLCIPSLVTDPCDHEWGYSPDHVPNQVCYKCWEIQHV